MVFHLFPVLSVLARDIRVTSNELGKSWESWRAAVKLNGKLQNSNVSPWAEDHNNGPCQHSIFFAISFVALVQSAVPAGRRQASSDIICCIVTFRNSWNLYSREMEQSQATGNNCTVCVVRQSKSDCALIYGNTLDVSLLTLDLRLKTCDEIQAFYTIIHFNSIYIIYNDITVNGFVSLPANLCVL